MRQPYLTLIVVHQGTRQLLELELELSVLVLVDLVELDHAEAAPAQHHVRGPEHRATLHRLAAVEALVEELRGFFVAQHSVESFIIDY